jgi:hypothetical protein
LEPARLAAFFLCSHGRMVAAMPPHSEHRGRLSCACLAAAAATALLLSSLAALSWPLAPAALAATRQPAARMAAVCNSSSPAAAGGRIRIGWYGRPLGGRPPSGLTVREARSLSSGNSGNLVWIHGAAGLVDPRAAELVHMQPPYHADVAAVLLPTANILGAPLGGRAPASARALPRPPA